MNTPARLHKVEEKTLMNEIETILLKYSHIILPILVIMLVTLIVLLCMLILKDVSAVESGTFYNHLQDVI